MASQIAPHDAFIGNLAVHPQHRGGTGRSLLLSCLWQYKEAGFKRVGLAVTFDNERAFRLYQSLGFATIARFPIVSWSWPGGEEKPVTVLAPETASIDIAMNRTYSARQTRTQFVKFCLVGASSTVVNFAVLALFIDGFGLRAWPHHLGILLGATIAFLVSVTNGFYWNRRWTFAGAHSRSAGSQYVSFILVNIVGLLINLSIVKFTLHLVDHTTLGTLLPQLAGPTIGRYLPKLYPYLAELMAAGVVVFWNFLANRKWTFPH